MQVYRVIYDARDVSDWPFILTMLLMAAAGLAVWAAGTVDGRLRRRVGAVPAVAAPGLDTHPLQRAAWMRRGGLLAAVVALMAAGAVPGLDLSGNRRLRRALETERYTVVEGRVTDFVRGDRGGHRQERFSVASNGRRYTYAYVSSGHQPGFHESHGPVREGLYVRIADVDGYIARLETAW